MKHYDAECEFCSKKFVYSDSYSRHLPGCVKRLRKVLGEVVKCWEEDEMDLVASGKTRLLMLQCQHILQEQTR